MHGLMNRSIQCFLRDTYGPAAWSAIAAEAGIAAEGFEAMLTYDDALAHAVLDAASRRLGRTRESILEDVGTYLVSHQTGAALRRLLRFGGVGFADFLNSLEELPDRGRLAVPDLDLPALELADLGAGRFSLRCRGGFPGIAHVVMGVLRALADDYGALVLLEHAGATQDQAGEAIAIHLLEPQFAAGRAFHLANPG